MKITNIDEAMEEAAKKQPAKGPKKMEKKPVPAKKAEKKPAPAKKVAPKAEPKTPKPPVPPAKKEKTPEPETSSDEPKTTEPAPKKKALPKKTASAPAKTTAPTKKAEPKEEPKAEEPEKPAQPWSAKGREANAEKRASMSSDEKQAEKDRSMRRMGFRQQGRGIGDRLKSAWKAFTGPAGGSTQHGQGKYKSVFHEIQRLMEQLRLVESILVHENITAEGLTGGQKNLDVASPFGKLTAADFATLRARRDEIRSVLVGQMIREELHKHNTTLAELNPRQRAALSETVKQRSSKMWEQLAEMDNTEEAVVMAPDSALRAAIEKYKQSQVHDNPSQYVKIMPAVERPVQKDDDSDVDEGKLSRLAAGLGLAGAAMMGGAQDAGAQSTAPAQPQRTVQSFTMQRGPDGNQVAVDAQGKPVKMQHTPADSVSTQKSRDMQLAVNKAEFDLRSKGIDPMASRDGKRIFKRDIVQNPDGTWTAKISPDRGESPMEEAYTLEEWMGMMEEAGYNLNEMRPETLASYRDKASAQASALFDKYRKRGEYIGDSPEAKASGDLRKYLMRKSGAGRAQSDLEQARHTGGDRERGISPEEAQRRSYASHGQPNPRLARLRTPRDDQGLNTDPYSSLRGSVPDVDAYAANPDLRRAQSLPTGRSMEEAYTLEEWMGMMEEAGYSLDERNMANKAAKNAWVAQQGQKAAAAGTFTNTNPYKTDDPAKIARNNLSMGRMAADKDMAIQTAKSTTAQNLDKFNKTAKFGSEVDIDRASPEFSKALTRAGRGTSTDFSNADSRRREMHRQQQSLGRSNNSTNNNTPGQKHRGTVPTGQPVSGMDASRDGTLGGKSDRDTRDKFGYGNGTKDLVARQAATKARLSLDRELRGASVPGTLDYARDKDTMKNLPAHRKYSMKEWIGMLDEAGYEINELSPELLQRAADKRLQQARDRFANSPGHAPDAIASSALHAKARNLQAGADAARKRDAAKTESISENTVSRLQELAGITQLNS